MLCLIWHIVLKYSYSNIGTSVFLICICLLFLFIFSFLIPFIFRYVPCIKHAVDFFPCGLRVFFSFIGEFTITFIIMDMFGFDSVTVFIYCFSGISIFALWSRFSI